MPSKPGMPDDENGRRAVLVGGRAPAEGFGNEAPGHGSPPSDEVGGAAVKSVARLIDHEAKSVDLIFVGRCRMGGAAQPRGDRRRAWRRIP